MTVEAEVEQAAAADRVRVVEWAEQQGMANFAIHAASFRRLADEANTTLALSLAGMAGALAYAAPLGSGGPATSLVFGAAWVCGYLALLSILLVTMCLWAEGIPTQHNEPKNLCPPGFSLASIREVELDNLQDRIERLCVKVERRARCLNALRLMAAATPLVFCVAAAWHR